MSSFFRMFLVRWLLALMVMPGLCYAQAAPSRMQTAVASLIQSKAIKRGFAANDPRIMATLQAGGSTIAGAAAAAAVVTAAGVTAPAWVTAAVVVGLGTAFSVGISLAIDGIAKWLFNSDGTVSVVMPAESFALSAGGPYWGTGGWPGHKGASGSWQQAIANADYWVLNGNQFAPHSCAQIDYGDGNVYMGCKIKYKATGEPYPENSSNPYPVTARYYPSGAPGTCAKGQIWFNDGCSADRADGAPAPEAAPGAPQSASDAVAGLSAEQKAKPLNPAVLAAVADLAWKKAAQQPGYEGVPYDESAPVTEADAIELQQAKPAEYPTVGDGVAPQPTPAGGASPFALPAPSGSTGTAPGTGTETPTEPGTGTGTSPSTAIDWGVLTPPVLEDTPSTASIIDPLLNLWPSWSSFAFPDHPSECPKPTFKLPGSVVGGASLHFTQMCDFLETNHVRQAMQAAFAVAWAIMIAFIVMSA